MKSVPDLKIEYLSTTVLNPDPRNARTHTDKQIELIAKSIKQFGWTNPIIIDEALNVMAGHARLDAAKLLECKEVPTIQVSHMTRAQKRAYVIADNRLAERAGWDFDILGEELGFLIDADLDFDIEVTGFDASDIDNFVSSNAPATREEEPVELPGDEPTISRPGDLWMIAKHRLLCSDALDPDSYVKLMAGRKAQMVFTDPPYNVAIAGNVSGLGKVSHREFVMGSGEQSRPEFTAFLRTAMKRMAEVSINGAIHFICMDWRHTGEMDEAGRAVYTELKNICVWTKTNAGMGAFYRSAHEFVYLFKVGTGSERV